MTINRFRLYGAVTVAGIAISLVLSACGPQPVENAAAESAAVKSTAPSTRAATSSPTALATPSRTATPTAAAAAVAPSPVASARPVAPAAPAAPAPVAPVRPEDPAAPVKPAPAAPAAPAPQVPAQPVVPAAPVQPALKSFTFPDGHISFSYPASWSVRTERGPGREGPPRQVEAIVSNRTGSDLFRVSSGADAIGCTAGPAHRTVLDKAATPGMRFVDGTTPMFGFIVESHGGQDWYAMAVMHPRFLQEGNVGSDQVFMVELPDFDCVDLDSSAPVGDSDMIGDVRVTTADSRVLKNLTAMVGQTVTIAGTARLGNIEPDSAPLVVMATQAHPAANR